ncbi:dapper homolog 2 [Ictalurus punctatus]|uniref:Dapper homolog 2 n=1 Tax=Ictalurus punctatus TaxID=7998 RepID=A0A2D0RLA1_ICTPU|nr:dapper homolog 2 [Ictalurus punctatus]
MSGRRSCVNSLWSGSERVRIGERLKATLAGIVELDVLRGRQLELIDSVLDESGNTADGHCDHRENLDSAADDGAVTTFRQQTPSPADSIVPGIRAAEGTSSRWSTLSWDIPSDLLSPPTPEPTGTISLDCDSRPSSGFYSVSGSSLSDSCYSVASEAAPGGPLKMGGPCRPHSLDHSTTQWREDEAQNGQNSRGTAQKGDRRPASTGELEIDGLMFLTGLCSSLGAAQRGGVLSTSTTYPQLQLDPKFCSDLVSRKTKEVYPYPSPLHAVALQSPLFTSCQNPSPTERSPSPQGDPLGEPEPEQPPVRPQPPPSPSLTQLEQYISRLVHQYHSRLTAETSNRASQKASAGSCYEGVHPKSASSSSLTSLTPCKSFLGNSARVNLSSIGKKASRNSINLGNLPSVTGEDFNISFHLNLNLNLNPSLNKTLNIDAKNINEQASSSCGHLSGNFITPTASPASSSTTVTSTPNWRSRPRISTCPSTISNRGSMEITGKTFGSLNFSKSLDWSGAPREEAEGCPPSKAPESPAKLSEDSVVVCEISRVSGLPRSVVVGLMEEGVELDAECFQNERERGEGSASPCNAPTPRSSRIPLPTAYEDRSGFYSNSSSNLWAGSGAIETDYISQQHRLQITHSDCHLIHTTQSNSPRSDHSGPTPSHTSPILPLPHTYSDSASSPGSSSRSRVHSPPRLLSNSPFTPAQLSVFRRDSPSQCSLPHIHPCGSPLEGAIRPRGGSLRQDAGAATGWKSQDRGWRRSGDGEGLYQGKHVSRELVRASTVSSYSGRDYSSCWEEEAGSRTPKKANKLWKGFESRLWGREEELEREERVGDIGWRHTSLKETSSSRVQERKENNLSRKKGTNWDGHSSSLRLSRRALFRSESQGFLSSRSQKREVHLQNNHWCSSLEIGREGRGTERGRNLVRKEDKHHSSTASLFHLSRSQSLEGSTHSISPLSSPSLSPSPPPSAPLTRSRSFRDLGRKIFGSMRSLSFNKNQKSKKKD